MRHPISAVAALVAATAFITTACSDQLGPAGSGEVLVTFQQTADVASAETVSDVAVPAPGVGEGRVLPDNVTSLTVTVTAIQLLPQCDEAGERLGDGQCADLWVSLPLDAPVTLNMLDLPSDGESPIVLTAGSVPAGRYHQVRLFIEDATVIFATGFTVGRSSLDADKEYPVEIPSARQSGIKVDIDLLVEEDGSGAGQEVGLLFDADATFQHVVATGNGRVILPPVIRARELHRYQYATS